MDNLKKSSLSFLKKECLIEFGLENGTKIVNDSSVLLNELIEKADFRNNKAVEMHLRKFILPEVAFYLSMQKNSIEKERAYKYLYNEIQKPALKVSKQIGIFKKLTGFYSIAIWVIKKIMALGFPKEGWKVEWIKNDKTELAMNIHSCLYMELFSHYGCPELCKANCDSDFTTYKGLEPKVFFERTQTISTGADFCNFRFLNGNISK
jgi:hypothetical protein